MCLFLRLVCKLVRRFFIDRCNLPLVIVAEVLVIFTFHDNHSHESSHLGIGNTVIYLVTYLVIRFFYTKSSLVTL